MPGSVFAIVLIVLIAVGVLANLLLLRWELDVLRRYRLPWFLIFVPGLVVALATFGVVRDLRSAVAGARRDARRHR